MAEAAMFSVASKLLSTIGSAAFKKAYEKACSIQSARDELDKLQTSIETIQAVLLDAEKKQESSAVVKNWIKRVRDVLYDAEDLFDEVTTDDMLRKQNTGNKLLKQVHAICSNNPIAMKVQHIRKSLFEIYEDMKISQFVECKNERLIYGMRRGQDTGAFVDSKNVIGRDEDKKAILKMLLDDSNDVQQDVSVIAIVGIGGMGKTTLAQLVYNHEEVKCFKNRWFACISDTLDDKEFYGKIFQSIHEGNSSNLSFNALQTKIKKSIEGKKFLLVLDDVWDDHSGRWQDRLSLLSRDSKGSKIIVTTRSLSVASVVGALETHMLDGLSEADSWNLFKRVASFTPEQERDLRWTNLGKEIVKKCARVPLAIKSIASLVCGKNTIEEWESFRNEELPKLGEGHEDGIMPVLKLSYEHLPSNLKHCFAYCALFPKDHRLKKGELIYLWISQGYIKPSNERQTVEDVGHSYFMDLFRRSFFQDLEPEFDGDMSCKMHDLIHDLAQHVAGEESVVLTTSSDKIDGTRHISACGFNKDGSLVMPGSLHNVKHLRSFIVCQSFINSDRSLNLEKQIQFANLKLLRSLSLPNLKIDKVPSYIGELKYLRYLDLSNNKFKNLPNSITKLVNLCTLNIRRCCDLEVLPNDFRKLINLRHLINEGCDKVMYMPLGFEKLTSLQRLDEFKVGSGTAGGCQSSGLDVLLGMELKGLLEIRFSVRKDDWDGFVCWQPPLNLQGLRILCYEGMRIPQWSNGHSLLSRLTQLYLGACSEVKCLPPLRHIPYLNDLTLYRMEELEYIQGEEEDDEKQSPDLKKLYLHNLRNLKGWWWRKEEAATREQQLSSQLLSFPSLSHVTINKCGKFDPMLLCPQLRLLELGEVNMRMVQQLLSATTSSSSLESVTISHCYDLLTFPGESFTSLQCLYIAFCNLLKQVQLAPSHINILESLTLWDCQSLKLWEEKERGVDWDSLPNLRKLILNKIPSPEMLPDCLRHRQELGMLKIRQVRWT